MKSKLERQEISPGILTQQMQQWMQDETEGASPALPYPHRPLLHWMPRRAVASHRSAQGLYLCQLLLADAAGGAALLLHTRLSCGSLAIPSGIAVHGENACFLLALARDRLGGFGI